MPNFGTLSTADLKFLATMPVLGNEQRIYDMVDLALNVHNQLMDEKMAALVERTTDRITSYGGPADPIDLEQVDEYGQADAQKGFPMSYTVGFPLRKYQASLQWTRSYFQRATAADIAAQVRNLQDGDVRLIDREIKKALFKPTNTVGYIDRLINHASFDLKALLNADGSAIPMDQYGNTFNGATHTHYLTATTLNAAALDSLITTVVEHHPNGEPQVWINQAQEATVRAITGFNAYVDARIVQPFSAQYAQGRTLDMTNTQNRAIGVYGAAEVWVKPWIPAGYLFCYNPTAGKPLRMRVRDAESGGDATSGNLVLVFEDEKYPLRARTMEREAGFAAFTRTNGAVMQITAGAYAAPTFP